MNEKFILTLVDKFSSTKIDELDFNDGTTRLVLRKGFTEYIQAGTGQPRIESSVDAASETQGGKSVYLGMPANASPEAQGGGEKITSPIVATFYAALSPDSPALVKTGSKVKAGDTLCILEAMKMMNHLEADFDCEILEVHASNGDFVEYDQVLFTVKRL